MLINTLMLGINVPITYVSNYITPYIYVGIGMVYAFYFNQIISKLRYGVVTIYHSFTVTNFSYIP